MLAGQHNHLKPFAGRLRDAGIRVSLFINPDPGRLLRRKDIGADIVELHAGAYCEEVIAGDRAAAEAELARTSQGRH